MLDMWIQCKGYYDGVKMSMIRGDGKLPTNASIDRINIAHCSQNPQPDEKKDKLALESTN